MASYSLRHRADQVLLRDLATLVARDRANTAALLAHLAEVDARRLYAPAGYPSMFAYCVQELGLSEDGALLRIRAARAAREFPAIFDMVSDGRLTLSAIHRLAPHLTTGTAEELLSASARKTKTEIELLLAARCPRPDLPTRVEPLSAPGSPVAATHSFRNEFVATIAPPAPRPRVAPLSPERFALQVTIAQATRDKLRHAEALLGHAVAPGDLAEVLDRALDALIAQLEKRKFAKTDRPRPNPAGTKADRRHVPAAVKRTVWARDGGRCTFVSEAGRRCDARTLLEFDHANELARGGQATVSNLRLRCRAHNQYGAERSFGAGFMARKRREAREAAARNDVIPWLRSLGFRAEEARRAAARCGCGPDTPLEERVRRALMMLGPAPRLRTQVSAPNTAGQPANGQGMAPESGARSSREMASP